MSENTENKYLVVEFPNERDETGAVSMAIISSSWIFEDDGCLFCYWPSYFRSDLLKDRAVQNHWTLQEDKCMKCPILVKFTTDDYLKARSKLQRLEIESQTESEIESESRRKPKKKNFNDYESDSSDIDIPQVPLQKNFLTNLENSKKYQNSTTSSCGSTSQRSIKTTKIAPHEKYVPNISTSQRYLERTIDLDEISTTSSGKLSTPSCTGCDENKKLLTEVMRQLRIIKEDTNHLIRLFVDKEERQVTTGEVEKVNNFDDLSKLNDDLSDKTKFAEMCSMLQYIGGKDENETCRKILCNLITNELAIQTNWTGRNEKNGFKDLKNLIQLIHVSVRKNPLSKDCTINSVETTIKAWLRTAGDREGGRAKRNAQK